MVKQSVAEVVQKNQAEACNVKILLIGGPSSREASLEIICLSPLFPDRSLYKSGAKVITYKYEREYPAAKTLNMLSSYLAFRQAKLAGAYDALLVNRKGCVTEGTRANFFGLKGCTIMSPPPNEILTGVTRVNMLRVARQEGFEIIEQDIPLSSLDQFDSLFLTSTSSKILPLCQVDETVLGAISPALQELIRSFDQFLSQIADN
jgi:branched-subunit amino acid aminotransferase/4-amino-4-deoxychorismate lyase